MSIYTENDATGLTALVAGGEITPDELLVDAALAQAAAWTRHLNALVHMQEDVARANIREGLPEEPFRGVPFGGLGVFRLVGLDEQVDPLRGVCPGFGLSDVMEHFPCLRARQLGQN